jgi:hypothetical protein
MLTACTGNGRSNFRNIITLYNVICKARSENLMASVSCIKLLGLINEEGMMDKFDKNSISVTKLEINTPNKYHNPIS